MAVKLSGGEKFQLEYMKRLLLLENVKAVSVNGYYFPWRFGALWYGFGKGEVLRDLDRKDITLTYEEYNTMDFDHSEFTIAEGYSLNLENVQVSEPVEIKDSRYKRKIIALTNGNAKVSIDSRYLEYFYEGVRFAIKDEFSPVVIIAEKVPVAIGLIFPFITNR